MDYASEVVRRFDAGLKAGRLADDAPGVVCGEAEDRALNVWVRFYVQVLDGRVTAARFQVFGCPHTVAAASWAAEWVEGRDARSLAELDVQEGARTLDIPVEKMGKLLRIEDALLACKRKLAEPDPVGKGI
jgi:nitrogen fixation NifU-like protein